MAQVTVQKVVEGPSNITIRLNLLSDGSGELTNFVILSATDLSPVRPNTGPMFKIKQLWFGMVWFDITLSMNSLAPEPVWTVARDCENHVDFRSFGGLGTALLNPPADYDGKLMISTNGFAAAGSQGSMVIEMLKVR